MCQILLNQEGVAIEGVGGLPLDVGTFSAPTLAIETTDAVLQGNVSALSGTAKDPSLLWLQSMPYDSETAKLGWERDKLLEILR